jgi:hypothetical protein
MVQLNSKILSLSSVRHLSPSTDSLNHVCSHHVTSVPFSSLSIVILKYALALLLVLGSQDWGFLFGRFLCDVEIGSNRRRKRSLVKMRPELSPYPL